MSPSPRFTNTQPDRKAVLRQAARERRRAIPEPQRARAAEQVARHLVDLPELTSVRVLLTYGANAEELDPGPGVERLRERIPHLRIAYPRVAGADVLELHEVATPDDLVLGAFAIREPRPDAPPVDPSQIDAVIVPGIAFDRRGFRIGYGGGYYDRLLATLPARTRTIGLAFDEQIVDEVPDDAHDVPVGVLVTPSGAIRARRD